MWDQATEGYSGTLTICTSCETLLARTPSVRETMYEQHALRWQDGRVPAVVERIDEHIDFAAVA
jgi:hypothetical protein